MPNKETQDLQAKSMVLKLSAIITFASLITALAAQHFGLTNTYSYCVGALGVIGLLLHIAVRTGVLKPQPLEPQIKKKNKSHRSSKITNI